MGELWGGGTASTGLESQQNTTIQFPFLTDFSFADVELIHFTLFYLINLTADKNFLKNTSI